MSREDIVAVAARLFAVFLAIYALRALFILVQVSGQMELSARAILVSVAGCAAMAGAALLLWVFPLSVARKLLPVMKEPRSESVVGVDTLFSLGLVLIGMWLLAGAIIDGVYWLSMVMAMRGAGMTMPDMAPDQKAGMIATGAEAIVALILILGSSGLRKLVYRFRNAHVDTPSRSGE